MSGGLYKTEKRLPPVKLNENVKLGKERREGGMENEDRDLKLLLATRRCAKAALLLSNLKSLPSHTLDDNEIKMLRREIEVLKVQLAKQRLINKRIKLCALSELIVQLILMLSLLTFFSMLVLKTH